MHQGLCPLCDYSICDSPVHHQPRRIMQVCGPRVDHMGRRGIHGRWHGRITAQSPTDESDKDQRDVGPGRQQRARTSDRSQLPVERPGRGRGYGCRHCPSLWWIQLARCGEARDLVGGSVGGSLSGVGDWSGARSRPQLVRTFTALDRRWRKESSREAAHHRSSCPRRGDGACNSHHGGGRRRGIRVRDGECRHRRCRAAAKFLPQESEPE